MIDPFGRTISYLRVSVTDRCDLRCVYCMSEDMNFLPKPEILTLEELDQLCAAFIRLGTDKIRITGGEPLVRRDVMTLFRSLGTRLAGGLRELTLTTNGSSSHGSQRIWRRPGCGASMSASTRSIPQPSPQSRDGAESRKRWRASSPPRRPACT